MYIRQKPSKVKSKDAKVHNKDLKEMNADEKKKVKNATSIGLVGVCHFYLHCNDVFRVHWKPTLRYTPHHMQNAFLFFLNRRISFFLSMLMSYNFYRDEKKQTKTQIGLNVSDSYEMRYYCLVMFF